MENHYILYGTKTPSIKIYATFRTVSAAMKSSPGDLYLGVTRINPDAFSPSCYTSDESTNGYGSGLFGKELFDKGIYLVDE